eukprot:1189832-Prorocentrum_minimum.AAC.2
MVEGRFLDANMRRTEVQMLTYNPGMEALTYTMVSFAYHPSGHYDMSYIMQALPLPLGRTRALANMDVRSLAEIALVVIWGAFVLSGLVRQAWPPAPPKEN